MLKNLLLILLILTYIGALFFSIYWGTAGLGIFSIAMSILFFMYILYAINKPSKDNIASTSIDDLTSIPKMLEFASSPVIIRLLPNILTFIFALLEKYHDRLEKKQSKKLRGDMQQLVDKLSVWHQDSNKNKPS